MMTLFPGARASCPHYPKYATRMVALPAYFHHTSGNAWFNKSRSWSMSLSACLQISLTRE